MPGAVAVSRWICLILLFVGGSAGGAVEPDSDGDGLSDEFEQQLLVRFAPRFLVSENECAGLPAEFEPGSADPKVLARNSTIYGQVFRAPARGAAGAFIEIHYYHLWERDCGRMGHALDAEHVSTLIGAAGMDEPVAAWKALYWYAGAHEDTVCDASSGARASVLAAEYRGPQVWISKGKHASYLNHGRCSLGCGGDQCDRMSALPPGKLINIGEAGAPMNGAVWVDSPRWPMAAKLATDFDDTVLALLDKPGVVPLKSSLIPFQAAILGADTAMDGLAVGGRSTDYALTRSSENTDNALSNAADATEHALRRTARAVARFLGARHE